MNISLQGLTKGASTDASSLYAQLRNLMADLEAQLNRRPNVNGRRDLKVPQGTKSEDVFVSLKEGVLRVGMYDGRRVRYLGAEDLQVLQKHNTNFKGFIDSTTAVGAAITRTTHFPNPGDWGFYRDAGVGFYIFFNYNNTSQFAVM